MSSSTKLRTSQWLPVSDLAARVQSGALKASELVEKALNIVNEKSDYNAIITPVTERARLRAAEIDKRVGRGEKVGQLAGVPFIAKDNFLTFGSETTAASNILRGFEAPYQATAVERLEAAGAICVAKANLDAFAHGTSTENSDFMVTKNPHDKARVPGGSSGGSAAAVVLGMTPFALGTDTGGSSRQPASLSGCVGYKPSYGLVSRSGVVAMASSTDTIGTLAATVDDIGQVLDVMAGPDELDSTTIDRDPKGYILSPQPLAFSPTKIGVIKEYMGEGLDTGIKAVIEAAVDTLKQAGAHITEVSLPSLPLSLACYYIICPAEVSSNLSRYDGQRYGFFDPTAQTLDESYTLARSKGFGREAKRRIMIGTYVLSSGYYDAYYLKALKLRTKLIKEFENAFKEVDFLIGPVAPTTAFKIGENVNDPLKMYLQDIYSVAVNLTGMPSISIPAGLSQNLPVGLQLMAPQNHDRALLQIAQAAEGILR